MKVHTFDTSFEVGRRAELAIVRILQEQYEVVEANQPQQRNGIDLLCCHRQTQLYLRFEIKADLRAHQSGNGFVEIISNDVKRKPGWVFTCNADLLLYFIPGHGKLLFFRPSQLRQRVSFWEQHYPIRSAQNLKYNTWGICVPLAEFTPIADAIATVQVKGFHTPIPKEITKHGKHRSGLIRQSRS